jgi:hypothetical protein
MTDRHPSLRDLPEPIVALLTAEEESLRAADRALRAPPSFRAQRLMLELRLARDAARGRMARARQFGPEADAMMADCRRLCREIEVLTAELAAETAALPARNGGGGAFSRFDA